MLEPSRNIGKFYLFLSIPSFLILIGYNRGRCFLQVRLFEACENTDFSRLLVWSQVEHVRPLMLHAGDSWRFQ